MNYTHKNISKIHVSLGTAYAVVSGERFLDWQAPKPRDVLFIEGEMLGYALKERVANIKQSCTTEVSAPIHFITPDMQTFGITDLSIFLGSN